MLIHKTNFDEVSLEDIEELIRDQIPESHTIEYKRELYGASDAEKRELLKDVSALANTNGGVIVIGIAEKKEDESVRYEKCPISSLDIDGDLTRLNQTILSGIEPNITGIKIKSVQDGACHYVVIRVPESWNKPYRICFQRTNRFWMRNSTGTYEPDLHGLRELFMQNSNFLERAFWFRNDRFVAIQDKTAIKLYGDMSLIVHIIPFNAFQVNNPYSAKEINSFVTCAKPLGAHQNLGAPRINFDGVMSHRPEQNGHYDGYYQVFKNGIIEAGMTLAPQLKPQEQIKTLSAINVEGSIAEGIQGYFKILSNLNVSPPFVVFITLLGVNGCKYIIGTWDFNGATIEQNKLALPSCIVENYKNSKVDYMRDLKPAIDSLWNAVGCVSAQTFDENGNWSLPRA